MRARVVFWCLVLLAIVVGGGHAWAEASDEEEHHETAPPAHEDHHDEAGSAAPEHEHEGAAPEHDEQHEHDATHDEQHEHDATHDEHEHDAAGSAHEEEHEVPIAELANETDPVDEDDDPGEVPTKLFDEDGDGMVTAEEQADETEYQHDFAGVPETIDTSAVDQELEARPAGKQMMPSINVEQFRKMVRIVKKVVLGKMEHKMEVAAAKKMTKFATGVVLFSSLGLLLLLMPIFLAKKYPGQGGTLFKYSALAAGVFVITVNLFGGVLLGMRGVQAALGKHTNPTLAIAAGTFDTLDRHAEDYAIMGKELFAPTLEQLRGGDEQPSVVLLANGQKVVKDAMVFVSVAKIFKRISFIFEVLPIILMFVTMLLFVLAIRPTLMEIIRLPQTAAAGNANAGRDVVASALRRVKGELFATLCTIGVLIVMTVLSGFVLGEVVAPAIDALIYYFSMTVSYLQFVDGASSGMVFMTLFAVILFLALSLGALIVSMGFFLGKMQRSSRRGSRTACRSPSTCRGSSGRSARCCSSRCSRGSSS